MKKKVLAIIISLTVTIGYIPLISFADVNADPGKNTNNASEVLKTNDAKSGDKNVDTTNSDNNDPSEINNDGATFYVKADSENRIDSKNNNSIEDEEYNSLGNDDSIDNNDYSSESFEKKTSADVDLRKNIEKYIIECNNTDLVYDGCSHKQNVTVKKYSFSYPLNEGIDYVLSGTTVATEPGTYTVIITGKGDYKGQVEKTWTISPIPINECTIKLSEKTYNGKIQTPEIESAIVNKTKKEISKSNFIINGSEKDAGNYQAAVTGTGAVTGTKEDLVWKINKEKIGNCRIETKDVKYDGNLKIPDITVKLGDQILNADDDYKIIYGDEIVNAGKYTISVIGENNIEGVKNITWKVNPINITDDDVFVSRRTLPYTGKELHQNVSVTVNGKTLTSSDYTVTGDSGTEIGEYELSVTGKNNYTGKVVKKWMITNLDVSVDKQSFGYDGEIHTPGLKVTLDSETLKEGTDYYIGEGSTLSESKAGNYTISIKGIGKYEDTEAIVEWTITPEEIDPKSFELNENQFIYDGEEKSVAVIKTDYGKNADLVEGRDYKVSKESKVKNSLPGDYHVIIEGIGNYSGQIVLDWKIKGYTLNTCILKVNKDTFVYNGKQQGPEIKLSTSIGNKTLTEGVDYEISGISKAKDAGDYILIIKGDKDAGYYGSREVSWSIKKKELAVEWKYEENKKANELVYNGKEQGVTPTLTGIEDVDKNSSEDNYKLNVVVSGNSIDAGSYSAKVTDFALDEEKNEIAKNYTITGNTEIRYNIEPELITPVWNNKTSFTYDGSEHAREATLTTKSGIKMKPVYLYSKENGMGSGFVYSGRKPTEEGSYVVKIIGMTDEKGKENDNYGITNDPTKTISTFTIIKSATYVDPDDDTRYAKEQNIDDPLFDRSLASGSINSGKKVAKLDSGVSKTKQTKKKSTTGNAKSNSKAAKPKSKTSSKTTAAKAKTSSKTGAKSSNSKAAKPKSKASSKTIATKAKASSKSTTKSSTGKAVKSESKTSSKTVTKAKTGSKTSVKAKNNSKPGTAAKTNSKSTTKSSTGKAVKAKSKTGSKTSVKAKNNSKPGTAAKTNSKSTTKSSTGKAVKSKSKTGSKTSVKAKNNSKPGTAAKTNSKSTTKSSTGSTAKSESKNSSNKYISGGDVKGENAGSIKEVNDDEIVVSQSEITDTANTDGEKGSVGNEAFTNDEEKGIESSSIDNKDNKMQTLGPAADNTASEKNYSKMMALVWIVLGLAALAVIIWIVRKTAIKKRK